MAKEVEQRIGNDAGSDEANWENQITWTRSDKGLSWVAHSVWPASDNGVVHFVKDNKSWEWEINPDMSASGKYTVGKNEMTRLHTKMAVDFSTSKLSADSKTATSTYKLHGLPPLNLTSMTGTFITELLGSDKEELNIGKDNNLRYRDDSFTINIKNENLKFKPSPGDPALNLPKEDFSIALRYNAVRGTYEIYGYSPQEIIGPGGEYNPDKFDRYILFESSTLIPGINEFKPVLESLSTYTLQLVLGDYAHKIKEYLIPAGITAKEIDIFVGDLGVFGSDFEQCSGNGALDWDKAVEKYSAEEAKMKKEWEDAYTGWKEVKDSLLYDGKEVNSWYWYDLRQAIISDISELEANIDGKEALKAESKKRIDIAKSHREACNKRNGGGVEDGECHEQCTKYCDDITSHTLIIEEAEVSIAKYKEDMKTKKTLAESYQTKIEEWDTFEAEENDKKRDYAEKLYTWYQTFKHAEILTSIKKALNDADAFVKDAAGCE